MDAVTTFGITQIMRLCLLGSISLWLASIEVVGQYPGDSIAIIQSKENILTYYDKALEGVHHLYNGLEYIEYEPLDDEHPYFETGEWAFSDLKYDGEWFRNVPLLYDISKDKLITSYYYNGAKMQLIQNRVDEFMLSNRHFINIRETIDSTTLKKGYYELLYDGVTKVLAKRSKNYSQTIDRTDEFRFFKEVNQIFLMVEGKPSKINSKGEAISVLKGKKSDLRTFIRENNLFMNDKEHSIFQLAKYFDRINQK